MYIHLREWYVEQEELGMANNLYMTPEILAKTQQTVTSIHKPKQKAEAQTRQVGGDHYKKMDVQPWDVIDHGPREQAIGFYRYNALKYVMRAGEKGEFKEDIAKAHHYLQKLLEILE